MIDFDYIVILSNPSFMIIFICVTGYFLIYRSRGLLSAIAFNSVVWKYQCHTTDKNNNEIKIAEPKIKKLMKQNDNCFTLNETRIHQNCQIEDLESWSGRLNRFFVKYPITHIA